MELYIAYGSPNCRKVQAVVDYLGVDLEIIPVDVFSGEHKSPEFLKKNPNGKVPVLEDDGITIWESNAIMQYIGSKKSNTLYPKSLSDRVDIGRWLFWESAHYGDAVGSIVWENFAKAQFGMGSADVHLLNAAIEKFHQFAPILESQLDGKKFVLGDKATLADFSLASHGAYIEIEAAQLPLDKYPNIKGWYARLNEIPAWRNSLPPIPQENIDKKSSEMA